MADSDTYKYEVAIREHEKPQRLTTDTKKALDDAGMIVNGKISIKGVSAKMFRRMKTEYVECPILKDNIAFLQCFVCPNFPSSRQGPLQGRQTLARNRGGGDLARLISEDLGRARGRLGRRPPLVGITVSKSEDFSEWYTQLVIKAELADYAPVKGLMVLRPDGYSIWESIRTTLDSEFAARGVRNAFLPTLIPESLLGKEKDHFAGFTPEVFWVTHSGSSAIGDKLALRPTSEAIAYDLYSKWIKSWRDLPLKINFWNTALRAEIKATKPFLRTSEFLWQEGHTVHETSDEAKTETREILESYRRIIENVLAIPVIVGTKSEREKFVGAVHTLALESIMPDGKALQMGTSHFLGQNFSIAFGIKYSDKNNVEHAAWQTSWGVSWRLIGAMVMVHGDDKGLILPPRVAPIQIIIVPIYYSDSDQARVMDAAEKMRTELCGSGIRATIDSRQELTPGFKFNDWELRGVPVRIEVGPKDVDSGEAVVVTRHDGAKTRVAFSKIVSVVGILDEIQNAMLERAKSAQRPLIKHATSYVELEKMIGDGGFVRAAWCGSTECEARIKDETGAEIRVVPFEGDTGKECVVCKGACTAPEPFFARGY